MAESPNAFFHDLYQANYRKMIKLAYRLVGSMETACDLVQETFLLALFQQETLACHASPEGWLMITLKNLAMNERRRFNRHPTLPLYLFETLPGEPPPMPLEHVLPSQLSQEDREILLWRFEQNMEYLEMADRLGIAESSCRSRVSRAVARCKACLNIPPSL